MSFFILPYLSLFGREFFCVTVILVGHIIFLKEHFTFPPKYWRWEEKLRLNEDGSQLLFDGKMVLWKSEVRKAIGKTFHACKSGGYRKLNA